MNICGIDPGFSGALAILNKKQEILFTTDMPTLIVGSKNELNEPAIRELLETYKPACVVLEKSQTMPRQGISSSGRYMASYGFLRGICVGLGIEYHLVHPKTWKKAMMHDMPKEKGASIQRVGQLYPELSFNRKKDHNICDAILLARYLLQKTTG